jgi:AraC family transcriptional regulator
MFGVCLDMDGKDFDYWIADLYAPWNDIPEGCGTYVIPGGLWAQFLCKGPLPESLQSVNTKIWSEWLPSLLAERVQGSGAESCYHHVVRQKPAVFKSRDTGYGKIQIFR